MERLWRKGNDKGAPVAIVGQYYYWLNFPTKYQAIYTYSDVDGDAKNVTATQQNQLWRNVTMNNSVISTGSNEIIITEDIVGDMIKFCVTPVAGTEKGIEDSGPTVEVMRYDKSLVL